MRSPKRIWILLIIIILSTATLLFFPMEKMKCTDDSDTIRELGMVDRLSATDKLTELIRKDGEVQNLTGNVFIFEGGIFNETGESTIFIKVPFPQTVSPFTPATGNNTAGWEAYRVIIDFPNETVMSIEKVEQFPDWVKYLNENITVTIT